MAAESTTTPDSSVSSKRDRTYPIISISGDSALCPPSSPPFSLLSLHTSSFATINDAIPTSPGAYINGISDTITSSVNFIALSCVGRKSSPTNCLCCCPTLFHLTKPLPRSLFKYVRKSSVIDNIVLYGENTNKSKSTPLINLISASNISLTGTGAFISFVPISKYRTSSIQSSTLAARNAAAANMVLGSCIITELER